MRHLKYTISLFAGLLLTLQMAGQDVLNKPVSFKELRYDVVGQRYYLDGNPYSDYKAMPTKDKSKGRRWNVITTHADTPILDKPNGKQVTTVDFSTFFYVKDEDGDYLQVTSDRSKPAIGWCNKDDLILWNNPLVDHKTGIELKAFMVNNFTGVQNLKLIRKNKEFYQVFDGPGKDAKKLDSRLIYDVFFVFKYENNSGERDKGRYLVSPFYDLNVTSPLLGWVEEGRTKIWKTALCIEPNFDPAALAERSEKDIMATVFTDEFGGTDQVEAYRKTGARGSALVGGPLRDPALGDYKLHPRMDGEIFRYPVFNGVRDRDNSKIITAVTGKTNLGNSGAVEGFDDAVYTQISKKSKELAENFKYKNIVFLLDGSDGTLKYLKLVSDYLNKAYNDNVANGVNTIKYGAVLYKNESNDEGFDTNKETDFCQTFPLNTNARELADKINDYPVGENGVTAEGEAVYYAMKKAMLMMVPNQENIIVHIGNAPDNTVVDPFFNSRKSETILSPNQLAGILKDKGIDLHYINFIGYSTEVKRSTRQAFFEDECENILPELALAQANKYFGVNFVITQKQPESPVLEKYQTRGALVGRMTKSPFQIKSYYLDDYNLPDVRSYLEAELDSCDIRTREFLADLKKVVEDESALNNRTSDFKMPVLALVIDQLIEKDADNEKFLKEFQEWCAAEKVQLFVKANTYYKCDALQEPLFKYVLFMHKSKLYDRLRQLSKVASTIQSGDEKESLAALQNYWVSMAESVLGGDKKYEKVTIEELRKKMLGVEGLDLMLPNNLQKFGNLTIEDVMKKRRLSAAEEDAMKHYITNTHENLKKIMDGQVYYQIEGTTTQFYWVPLEYIFG